MPHFEKPARHFPRPLIVLLSLVFVTGCHKNQSDSKQSDSSTADNAMTNLVMTPAAPSAPLSTNAAPAPKPLSPENQLLLDALRLNNQGLYDSALEKVSSVIQTNPKNLFAYSLRGEIYAKQKQWDLARKDYNAVLQVDAKNIPAKFNLSELDFMQKNYDVARPGFVALSKDSDWGDLAAYKVFLCDLFAGHDALAQSELDVFNKVGANASFYFGNAAFYLYHKRPEDARSWLNSGVHIYAPKKVYLYCSSLEELGYLPLPAAASTTSP